MAPIIGSFATWVAGYFGAAGTFAYSAAYAIAYVAASAALVYAEAALAKSLAGGGSVDPGQLLVLQQSSDQERQIIVGERLTAGSLVGRYVTGAGNNNVIEVIALADHKCNACLEYRADNIVQLTGLTTGFRQGVPAYRSSPDRLWVTWHNGYWDQGADSDLPFRSFVNQPGWTTSHRGRGISYAIVEMQWDDDVMLQPVASLFLIQGGVWYDRREDDTAGGSGAQRQMDPDTWAYTKNPDVFADHYQLGIVPYPNAVNGAGTPLYSWGIGLKPWQLPYDEMKDEADLSDEAVLKKDGITYQARYELNAVFSGGSAHQDILTSVAQAKAGRITDRGGRLAIVGPRSKTSVMTLYDTDLVVGEQSRYSDKLSISELANTFRGTFPDPLQAFRPVDYPPLTNPDWVTMDGGDELQDNVNISVDTDEERVQRLIYLYALDKRRQARLAECYGPWAMEIRDGDWFTRQGAKFPDGKLFEAIRIEYRVSEKSGMYVQITSKEVDPADVAWSADQAADLSRPPVPNQEAEFAVLDAPTITVTAVSLTTTGASLPAIKVAWSNVDDPRLRSARVDIAKHSDGSAVTQVVVDAGPTSENFTIIDQGILPGIQYDVRARYEGTTIKPSGWAGPEVITASGTFIVPRATTADAPTVGGTLEAALAALADDISDLDDISDDLDAAIAAEAAARAAADSTLTAADATLHSADVALSAVDATLSAGISTEASTRASADSTLTANLATATANIATNATAIATESSARASADSTLTANLATANAAITTNSSAIATEAATRASADSTLTANLSTANAAITTNSTAIATEAATRASADSTLTANVATNAANISTQTSALATETATRAGETKAIRARIGGASGSIIPNPVFNEVDATTGPIGWTDWTGSVSRVAGKVGTYGIRTDGTTASNLGTHFRLVSGNKPVVSPGAYTIEVDAELLSGTYGGVGVFLNTYDSGGSQIGSAAISLSTSADSNGDVSASKSGLRHFTPTQVTLPSGVAFIDVYCTPYFNLIGAGSGTNSIVWYRVDMRPVSASDAAVITNASAIATEAGSRASADSTLTANLATANAAITTNSTAIATEASTRASADSTLTANLATATANISTNATAISTEASSRASADSTLTANLATANSNISTNATAISTESSTRASADSTLTANLATANAAITTNATAISTEAASRASADSTLTAGLATANANIGTNATAISTETSARATETSNIRAHLGALSSILNPVFNEYPNSTGLPPNWSDNTGGTAGTRITGKVGAYGYRLIGVAATNNIFQTGNIYAIAGGSKYMAQYAVELTNASYAGAGVVVVWYDNTATQIGAVLHVFSTLADTEGTVSSSKLGLRFFRPDPITAPSNAAYVLIAPCSHYSSLGSIAAANQVDWHQVDILAAGNADASVSVIQSALAGGSGSLALLAFLVNTTTNAASLKLISTSGGAWNGSIIELAANYLRFLAENVNFGANTTWEAAHGTFYTVTGSYRTRILGPFGASSDLVLWYGLNSVALNSETPANSVFYINTSGQLDVAASAGLKTPSPVNNVTTGGQITTSETTLATCNLTNLKTGDKMKVTATVDGTSSGTITAFNLKIKRDGTTLATLAGGLSASGANYSSFIAGLPATLFATSAVPNSAITATLTRTGGGSSVDSNTDIAVSLLVEIMR